MKKYISDGLFLEKAKYIRAIYIVFLLTSIAMLSAALSERISFIDETTSQLHRLEALLAARDSVSFSDYVSKIKHGEKNSYSFFFSLNNSKSLYDFTDIAYFSFFSISTNRCKETFYMPCPKKDIIVSSDEGIFFDQFEKAHSKECTLSELITKYKILRNDVKFVRHVNSGYYGLVGGPSYAAVIPRQQKSNNDLFSRITIKPNWISYNDNENTFTLSYYYFPKELQHDFVLKEIDKKLIKKDATNSAIVKPSGIFVFTRKEINGSLDTNLKLISGDYFLYSFFEASGDADSYMILQPFKSSGNVTDVNFLNALIKSKDIEGKGYSSDTYEVQFNVLNAFTKNISSIRLDDLQKHIEELKSILGEKTSISGISILNKYLIGYGGFILNLIAIYFVINYSTLKDLYPSCQYPEVFNFIGLYRSIPSAMLLMSSVIALPIAIIIIFIFRLVSAGEGFWLTMFSLVFQTIISLYFVMLYIKIWKQIDEWEKQFMLRKEEVGSALDSF
ncbi:MAG: hypothetical protein V2B20_15295 [Pseudomonadota bacterium]